jgi:hypothetical protein
LKPVVGFITGSRGEAPGKKENLWQEDYDDDDDNNNNNKLIINSLF